MSSQKAFTLSSISVCVSWICAKIAITADEPVEFTTGIRSSGPITITGSVWVPTLTFPRSFCSICNLTRSCSSGVSSSRVQYCIFSSASSEVELLEPWLRMWILFPLKPYGIKYRSKKPCSVIFYVCSNRGLRAVKDKFAFEAWKQILKPLFDHLIKNMVTTLLSLKHCKK